MTRSLRLLPLGLALFALQACSADALPARSAVDPTPLPTPELELSPEAEALRASLEAAESLSAGELLSASEVPFEGELGYDPLAAEYLDLIQGSSFALGDPELARLARDGFVIDDRRSFPSFGWALTEVYAGDLPVYVSADAILDAVHRSYSDILKFMEFGVLAPALDELLEGLRGELAPQAASLPAAEDIDLHLAVALSLLRSADQPGVAGASSAEIAALRGGAEAAEGLAEVTLYGTDRVVDFSQFTPRGHYTDDPALERYFRAMMWLGRIDFRLLEAQGDGSLAFRRDQVDAMVGLAALMTPELQQRWDVIDVVVRAFVGEPDMMVLPEVGELLTDLGVRDLEGLASKSDAEIVEALLQGNLGVQRIASHFIVNPGRETLPLSRSFAFFPQRYVVDSEVFANVVYDRVQRGSARRMMPSTLDVAYAVFGQPQAADLLAGELETFGYAPDLEQQRLLVEAHGESFWESNLYNLWLASLRGMSPDAEEGFPAGLPMVARSESWGRRVLQTQLGSWAELRHDTLLYAKQSYTSGAACAYPDAYVDPYPEVFAALDRFASRGLALVDQLRTLADPSRLHQFDTYFAGLGTTARMLEGMAEKELVGEPFSADELTFINQAVATEAVCADIWLTGWYSALFFDRLSSLEADPVVADVHTQPTDANGNIVGRVLHVGVGLPRAMVVTVATCDGPRAYVGPVFSYHERITEDFERMDDEAWAPEAMAGTLEEVPFLEPLFE
ncbi:MAG: DUF3160 domain-containing protein [Myxococcota bacterium]